jgi:chitodextrinase
MAIANGKVLVAGDFTHANGEPSLDQAIFDAFTGQFRPMQTNLDFTALSAATDGNNFYVGFAGSGGGRVAAWDTSGKLLWKSGCNGDVQAITYASSRVIPGGHYTKILGTWINRLVALTTTKGTLDTSWNPDPNSGGDRGVWALTVTDKLYAGGAFEQMGTNQARGFAQFSIVDAAAPSTPSNLVATVSTASQVDLVWAASTDDVAVTAYEIYRNGEFLAATSRVNLFSDDTALPLSGYTYQVRARDGVGNVSGLSDEAFATTPGDAAPPTTPRNLAALAVSSTRVDLTWEESSDDSFVAGYDIYRKGLLLTNVGPGSAFSDLSVKPSRFYNYQIVARDGSGNVSGFSNKATVSTSGDTEPPTAPSSLAANAVNSTQIGLSWAPSIDNVGVTAYQVFRDGGLLATLGIATNYLDKTVSPLNTYQYEVRGRDAAGNLSDPSIPAVASTPADTQPPSAPKGLIAAASSPTTIQLTWKSSTDNVAVIGYDILRQGLVIASVGIETNYADTSVSPSTTYNYRVRAFDAAGNSSPQSAKFTVTTPPVDSNAPSAPTALTANPLSATEIDLTWNPATDDVAVVAYDIYRDGILLASVGTATNFSDTTALPQTTYSYQLTASDAAQNVSAASDPAMATTPADTDAPTAPAGLTASAVSSTEIDLQWNASTDNVGVSAYDIYRNNVFLTSIGPISSYSDTSVNDMESYSYQVIARDEAGNMSDPSNATDPLTP